jgi:hypothetical protein
MILFVYLLIYLRIVMELKKIIRILLLKFHLFYFKIFKKLL